MAASKETELGLQIRKMEQVSYEKENITRMMKARYKSLTTVHRHFVIGSHDSDV